MDAILIIVLFVLFTVVTDRLDKKKRPSRPREKSGKELPRQLPAQWPRRPVPTNQDEPLPFEIPELRNAPSPADEVYREEEAVRQQEKKLLAEQYRQIHVVKPQPQPVRAENAWRIPALTPQSAQQAVVLAEILGRPKAYRR